MPTQNIHVVQEVGTLEEAYEALAKLQKTLRYLLNGNLDFENVRVKGLTAETIDVDKLSAIAADLGHITAGLIEAVDIFGSYIATSKNFPKVEFSSTSNLLQASADALRYIQMYASHTSSGSPTLEFKGGTQNETIMYQTSNSFRVLAGMVDFLFSTAGHINLQSSNVKINGGISLDAVNFPNSSATDVPGLVNDFNNLLMYLRAMNILA